MNHNNNDPHLRVKEMCDHHAVVMAGGAYCRCVDCELEGIIFPDNPAAIHARKKLKVPPPHAIGLEISAKQCPRCSNRNKIITDELNNR